MPGPLPDSFDTLLANIQELRLQRVRLPGNTPVDKAVNLLDDNIQKLSAQLNQLARLFTARIQDLQNSTNLTNEHLTP